MPGCGLAGMFMVRPWDVASHSLSGGKGRDCTTDLDFSGPEKHIIRWTSLDFFPTLRKHYRYVYKYTYMYLYVMFWSFRSDSQEFLDVKGLVPLKKHEKQFLHVFARFPKQMQGREENPSS